MDDECSCVPQNDCMPTLGGLKLKARAKGERLSVRQQCLAEKVANLAGLVRAVARVVVRAVRVGGGDERWSKQSPCHVDMARVFRMKIQPESLTGVK